MTSPFINIRALDAMDLYIGTDICNAEDLYLLDGETGLRRRNGTIETFELESLDGMGGQP